MQAAVFLGNDHAEEFLFLEELPQIRRQISTFNGQVPGVTHGNGLGALVVHKGLLFLRQARVAVDQQAVPVGAPGKQLAIPTDGPRFQGHFFGIGHLGSHFLEHGEYPRGQPAPAKSRQTCSGGNGGADKQYEREQSRRQEKRKHACYHHHPDSGFGTGFLAHHNKKAGNSSKKQYESHHGYSLSSVVLNVKNYILLRSTYLIR